jgi:ribonuclease VapC
VIVDSSALVAILLEEPELKTYAEAIAGASPARLSAANYVEVGVVVDTKRNPRLGRRVDDLIEGAGVLIEPVTGRQARIAREAYRDYGRGSGHPARLNFGDCFAYALARDMREPLLFKGDDFSHTDVESALDPR